MNELYSVSIFQLVLMIFALILFSAIIVNAIKNDF